MNPVVRYGAAEDGLHVRVWGAGDPSLMFIHGLGDGGFIWNHIIPRLTYSGTAIAVDLRGHGDSPHDSTHAYTPETHVADVSAILQRLCTKPVIVVGHSLGAEIALRLWAEWGHGIRALVLVEGGPQLDSQALSYTRQQFALQPWVYRTTQEYVQHMEARFPLCPPALLGSLVPHSLRTDSTGQYQLKCDRFLARCAGPGGPGLWPVFRSVACPILAIRGAGSAILPRDIASRMTRENSRCELRIVPLAGHAVMLDNPSEFVAALNGYF